MNLKYIFSRVLRQLLSISAIKDSEINSKAKIGLNNQIVNSSIGRYSYTGYGCTIIYAAIGAFSSIADGCTIGGGSHPTEWLSTSPVFYDVKNIFNIHFSKHYYDPYKETRIGNDVWIGTHSLIRGGVTIGDGAIVGMGSVVTKNIGPYEIWAGNPAKLIRKRFSDDVIQELLMRKWWELDELKLRQEAIAFNDISRYLKE